MHLFDGTAHAPEIATRAAEADVLLVSAPPGQAGDPVLAVFGETLRTGSARVVYLSTVGVYGDHQGAWVDENTEAAADGERARARLTSEAEWRTTAANGPRDPAAGRRFLGHNGMLSRGFATAPPAA